jgi:hypothetical protein
VTAARPLCAPVPASLLSRNPLRWLAVFGPGAVIASLTIGVGELVFSSRAGALFGYRPLCFFLLVLVLKWILVYGSARHFVLTGAHPFQRWMELSGPRGWLPLVFLLLAVPCFPIWVCFHAGTLGTLLSFLSGTEQAWRGGAHLGWGIVLLAAVLALCAAGGYRALERIQLAIVLLMLGSVTVAVFFIRPDWWELLQGLLLPQSLAYPSWVTPELFPEVASRPIWLEATTYAGVIGGSSYDYLAYTSYLRDKHWGRAGMSIASAEELERAGCDNSPEIRRWLRAPLVDCTLSFAAVLLFTAVFMVCGAVVLGPQHKVPGGSNLLSLQADFVTSIYPWLRHVYFAGAFLAVFGTLYGTIEVAPTVLRELVAAFSPPSAGQHSRRFRLWSITWVGAGGLVILGGTLSYHLKSGSDQAPGLIAILTPANLFTGVLGCGIVCLLNLWMDRRFLPRGFRPPLWAELLTILAGLAFLALGLRGAWDHSGWTAFLILLSTVALGWLAAWLTAKWQRRRRSSGFRKL